MDYLTEAMKALQRGRSQERMTGNRRDSGIAGANQDEPLYEGYFDAAMKNRRADRAQAIQQQQFSQQMKFAEKTQKQSNALGWGSLAAQTVGYLGKPILQKYLGVNEQGQATNAPALTHPMKGFDTTTRGAYADDVYGDKFGFPTYDESMQSYYQDTTSVMGDWFGDWSSNWFDFNMPSFGGG